MTDCHSRFSRCHILILTTCLLMALSWRQPLADSPRPPALLVLCFGPNSNSLTIGTSDGIRVRSVQNATLGQISVWRKGALRWVVFSSNAKVAAVVSERKVTPANPGETATIITEPGELNPA
jgi:hypothetical protein